MGATETWSQAIPRTKPPGAGNGMSVKGLGLAGPAGWVRNSGPGGNSMGCHEASECDGARDSWTARISGSTQVGVYTRTGLGGDKFQGEGSGQTLGLFQVTANGVGRKPGVCSMLEAREGQVFG